MKIVLSEKNIPETKTKYTRRELYTIFIICLLHLVVYVDRANLLKLSHHIRDFYKFDIGYKQHLNTAFLSAHAISAPIYGYLGDRRPRRKLIFITACLWAIATLLGAFATEGWTFILTRAIVGFFQAGFLVVLPSILADIARDTALSTALTYTEMMVPIGMIFGILLSEVAIKDLGAWWYSFYILAGSELLLGLLLIPGVTVKRGFKDVEETTGEGRILKATSYAKDLKYIWQNRTFLLGSIASCCNFFFNTATFWYGAEIIKTGDYLLSERNKIPQKPSVSSFFYSGSLVAGLIGVPLGAYWSRLLKPVIPNIDPIICSLGVLLSIPLYALGMLTSDLRTWESLYYLLLSQISMNSVWVLSLYVQIYVMIPTRRCSARAMQIFLSRTVGDLLGPYAIGEIRELFYDYRDFSQFTHRAAPDIDIKPFYTLRSSFLVALGVQIIGSLLFMWTSAYVVEDIELAKAEISELAKMQSEEESKT